MTLRPVRLELKCGPVRIIGNDGSGVDTEREFTKGIMVSEFYPKVDNRDAAYYILTFRKPVGAASEIEETESELRAALESLAAAWLFSGGNRLSVSKTQVRSEFNFSSNADEVGDQFAADRGVRNETATIGLSFCASETWRDFPLKRALEIRRLASADVHLDSMLQHYQMSFQSNHDWFVWLYNILDVIKDRFARKPRRVATELGIHKCEISVFEKRINGYTNRHSKPSTGIDRAAGNRDRHRLGELSRRWISRYIAYLENSRP